MFNDYFADFKILFGDENGNVAIEFSIKVEMVNNDSAVGFKSAIHVMNRNAG